MATTIQLYNHTVNRFINGLNGSSDVYKVELLNASASFNAAHTTKTEVDSAGSYEVYGYGWPQGGYTLTNFVLEVDDTNGAKVDADDVLQEISGGSLGPYIKYVILNTTDSNSPPVAFFTMPSAVTVPDGLYVGINWNSTAIISFTVA